MQMMMRWWMLRGTMVSPSERFRKYYKFHIAYHFVCQTLNQITSPKCNHNHNVQPPTQTHIPGVHFRVTLPTTWYQLARVLTVQWQEIYWCLDESNNWGHTGKHGGVLTLTEACLLMPSVIFALLLLYLTYNSFFLIKQEHSNTLN